METPTIESYVTLEYVLAFGGPQTKVIGIHSWFGPVFDANHTSTGFNKWHDKPYTGPSLKVKVAELIEIDEAVRISFLCENELGCYEYACTVNYLKAKQ